VINTSRFISNGMVCLPHFGRP